MKIEYEATFQNIEKEDAQKRLTKAGAKLVRPEFLQKRNVFDLPKGHDIEGGFIRVRDEGNKITLTLKVVDGTKISDQKETEIIVSDFDTTVSFLLGIGCVSRTYEESTRELWSLDDVDITIDGWPFLGFILEVEGKSEAEVKIVSEKLGFDWAKARFCTTGTFYKEKYGYGPRDLSHKTGKVTELRFAGENPFIGT